MYRLGTQTFKWRGFSPDLALQRPPQKLFTPSTDGLAIDLGVTTTYNADDGWLG